MPRSRSGIRCPLTFAPKESRLSPTENLGQYFLTRLRAIIHVAEEGGFWAEVPALPGCVTQADTREELGTNLQEAVEGWLSAGEAGMNSTPDEIFELAV